MTDISRGPSFVRSPLYHLSAFSIRNPWVQWAISAGAYVDLKDRPLCADDFAGADDLALARKVAPREIARAQRSWEWLSQLRR